MTSLAQGEELRALSARPVMQDKGVRAKADIKEEFIYEYQPQSLPLMDDFSIDRTRQRWARPGDPGVTLDAIIYRLEVDGISMPDMVFTLDTTFRFEVDISDPDTIIVTAIPLPLVEVVVRDLSSFPPAEELVEAWPPYNIFDTLGTLAPDTLFLFNPELRQDSLFVYRVAPDPRTYDMNGVQQPLILWEDDDVFVIGTYPLNPPSVGVATFDGLARNGLPYEFNNFSSYGIADKLTSVPIQLNRPASDSIYLSFYYQAQGLSGDFFPQPQDSLVLEFYAPLEDIWYRVWRTPYIVTGRFEQAMIPIKEFRYLQDGFRMRFLNYATLSGAFDHWHLDYVRLAPQRTFDDTTLVDVAYVYPEASILGTYTSMPLSHFEQAPAAFMAPSVTVLQRNLDDEDRLVTWRMRGHLTDVAPGPPSAIIGSSIAGNAASVFPAVHPINSPPDNNFVFDPTLSTDAAFWKVQFITNATPDINRYNDTVSFVQELSNYYAYDDGSAEMGYGLNVAGARLAYRYDLVRPDSLRAIRLYFNPMANEPPLLQPTQGNFLLTVWKQLSPEVIAHQNFSFSSPQYRDQGINKFVEYALDSTIAVEGTIYIGWVQTNGANMNLGFDRNRDNSNKIFFKVGANWQNTSFQGSLMMRPVFVSATDPFTAVEELDAAPGTLLLYPNPANDLVWLRSEGVMPGTMVECLDATGRILLHTPWIADAPLSTASWANGMYTVRLVGRSGEPLSQARLMIAR